MSYKSKKQLRTLQQQNNQISNTTNDLQEKLIVEPSVTTQCKCNGACKSLSIDKKETVYVVELFDETVGFTSMEEAKKYLTVELTQGYKNACENDGIKETKKGLKEELEKGFSNLIRTVRIYDSNSNG